MLDDKEWFVLDCPIALVEMVEMVQEVHPLPERQLYSINEQR